MEKNTQSHHKHTMLHTVHQLIIILELYLHIHRKHTLTYITYIRNS